MLLSLTLSQIIINHCLDKQNKACFSLKFNSWMYVPIISNLKKILQYLRLDLKGYCNLLLNLFYPPIKKFP